MNDHIEVNGENYHFGCRRQDITFYTDYDFFSSNPRCQITLSYEKDTHIWYAVMYESETDDGDFVNDYLLLDDTVKKLITMVPEDLMPNNEVETSIVSKTYQLDEFSDEADVMELLLNAIDDRVIVDNTNDQYITREDVRKIINQMRDAHDASDGCQNC